MMGFHVLFPEEAETECRAVTPVNSGDLPQRTFLFVEAYCVEAKCDCRRVMLNVIDAESRDQVAAINYAFEPPEPPFDDEEQMFLDPLNPQSELSDAFLDLFEGIDQPRPRLPRRGLGGLAPTRQGELNLPPPRAVPLVRRPRAPWR
jgi:hypothetical protein